jgi:Zn-dependent M28 family amino/carboxypeptidase
MQDRGERIRMKLEMAARTLPDAPSANVVGEIRGSEKPDEVIIISGHLDSWDVGQGAQDDGAGAVIALDAARIIQQLGFKPRRTIRVVLWTNEENGLRGGKAYLEAHRAELSNIVAAVESDSGSERLKGFGLDLPKATAEARATALAALKTLSPALAPFDTLNLRLGHGGADISPIVSAGVPGLGADHAATHYFDIHHTQADTLDKIDKDDLAYNSAALAAFTYALAQSTIWFR